MIARTMHHEIDRCRYGCKLGLLVFATFTRLAIRNTSCFKGPVGTDNSHLLHSVNARPVLIDRFAEIREY